MKLYNNAPVLDKIYIRLRLLILNEKSLRAIEMHVPRKGKILDVGCGHGLFANFLKLTSPQREVFGFDTNVRKINIARRTKLCRFFQQSSEKARNKYDAVCMVDVLHHIPYGAQEKLIKSTSAKTLVIKDMDKKPYAKYLWNYIHDILVSRSFPLFYRSESEMEKLLESSGFNVKVKRLNNPFYSHVLYICERKE